MSSNRSVDPTALAGDPFRAQTHHDELLRAAAAAMRLLQDCQQHAPEEQLDSRERKVLRQLRDAYRARPRSYALCILPSVRGVAPFVTMSCGAGKGVVLSVLLQLSGCRPAPVLCAMRPHALPLKLEA